MEPEGTQPKTVDNIVALEQARFWEAYWADPNDYQLRNQLAQMNSGLIGWMFKRLGRLLDGISEELREEAEQEAFLGLLHAVELFDPLKGFTFATYAPHWIHQAIDRYLKNARNPIRIPVHVGEAAGHFWKAEKAFFKPQRAAQHRCLTRDDAGCCSLQAGNQLRGHIAATDVLIECGSDVVMNILGKIQMQHGTLSPTGYTVWRTV